MGGDGAGGAGAGGDEEEGFTAMAAGVNAQAARFPHCVVWTPLPIVSWLSPLIGHVGICRADGVIVDFAGPYFVNVDNFAFGSPTKYIPVDLDQCCFPGPDERQQRHQCKDVVRHSRVGTAGSWDEGLRACMHKFQHKAYNFFTCNCHSFVSTCLNRAAYRGSVSWNIIALLLLIHSRGRWVTRLAFLKSFAPFLAVISLGIFIVGWPFLLGWALISFLFMAWFAAASYCIHGLIDC